MTMQKGKCYNSLARPCSPYYNRCMSAQQKENVWYIAVGITALLVAAAGEAAAVVFVPVVLFIAIVGFWAFDVK